MRARQIGWRQCTGQVYLEVCLIDILEIVKRKRRRTVAKAGGTERTASPGICGAEETIAAGRYIDIAKRAARQVQREAAGCRAPVAECHSIKSKIRGHVRRQRG